MADHVLPTSSGVAVGFYRGLSANLNALSSYKDGAFYITTDTDRLYYAQSSSELVQLNKSIQVVTSFPTTGQVTGEFYYNTTTAELAYYNGKQNGEDNWVHVNYYANTSVKSIAVSDAVSDSTGLTFNLSLQQQDKNGANLGTALTDSFKITKDQINALVVHPDIPDLGDIQVTLGATVNSGTATVSLGGKGAASSNKSFTIKGSGDVTVGGAANAITIDAKAYELSNKHPTSNAIETAVILDRDNVVKGRVDFTDDDKDIVITATEGAINIAHKAYDATSKDGTITTGTVANGGTITVVKGVDLSNGHVTGIRTGSFTLPTIPDDKYATAVNADNTGEITITMNQGAALKSGQDLYYTINGKTIYNQGDLTDDVKKIIENNLSKVTNAMTFKGSLEGGQTAAAKTPISTLVTSASIGDVYIVKSGFIGVDDFADTEDIAGIGDMIIASSSDDTETDGVIPSSKLKWTVIEGTEVDTTYAISAASNKLTLTPSTGSAQNITLADDDIVTLTSASNTITAAHKTYAGGIEDKSGAAEKELAFGDATGIDVIVGYDDDGYGHVEKLYKTKLTIPALPDQTNDHYIDGDTTNKKAILKNASGTDRGSIQLINGTSISVSCANTDDATGDDVKFTINHANVTRSDPATATEVLLTDGTEFTVVTGVTTNNQGHVTAVSTAKYEAQDTTYKLGKAKSGTHAEGHAGLSVASNIATVTDYLYTTDGAAAGSSTFKLASKNDHMVISKDSTAANQINIGLFWGTF